MDDGFSFQLPAMIGWRAWSCVVVRGAAVGANAAAGASASASTSLAMVLMHLRCDGGVMMAVVQCARAARVYLCCDSDVFHESCHCASMHSLALAQRFEDSVSDFC